MNPPLQPDHYAPTSAFADMPATAISQSWRTIIGNVEQSISDLMRDYINHHDYVAIGLSLPQPNWLDMQDVELWAEHIQHRDDFKRETQRILDVVGSSTSDRSVHTSKMSDCQMITQVCVVLSSLHPVLIWTILPLEYTSELHAISHHLAREITTVLQATITMNLVHRQHILSSSSTARQNQTTQILQLMKEQLSCHAIIAWHLDRDSGVLSATHQLGIVDEDSLVIPLGRGYLGTLLSDPSVSFIPEIDPDQAFHRDLVILEGWDSMAIFPIFVDYSLSGAIAAYWRGRYAFSYLDSLVGIHWSSSLALSVAEKNFELQQAAAQQKFEDEAHFISAGLMTLEILHDVNDRMHDLRDWVRSVVSILPRNLSVANQEMVKDLQEALRYVSVALSAMAAVKGVEKTKPQLVDLYRVAQRVEQVASVTAEKQKTRLVVIGSPDEAIIRSDPHHAERILYNLVSNALYFTNEKPAGPKRVMISVRRDGDIVRAVVEDTGVGIEPEVLSRIFDLRFTTKGSRGFGFGLYISRRLARLWGGDILVDSTFGEGARFAVTFPHYSGK